MPTENTKPDDSAKDTQAKTASNSNAEQTADSDDDLETLSDIELIERAMTADVTAQAVPQLEDEDDETGKAETDQDSDSDTYETTTADDETGETESSDDQSSDDRNDAKQPPHNFNKAVQKQQQITAAIQRQQAELAERINHYEDQFRELNQTLKTLSERIEARGGKPTTRQAEQVNQAADDLETLLQDMEDDDVLQVGDFRKVLDQIKRPQANQDELIKAVAEQVSKSLSEQLKPDPETVAVKRDYRIRQFKRDYQKMYHDDPVMSGRADDFLDAYNKAVEGVDLDQLARTDPASFKRLNQLAIETAERQVRKAVEKQSASNGKTSKRKPKDSPDHPDSGTRTTEKGATVHRSESNALDDLTDEELIRRTFG